MIDELQANKSLEAIYQLTGRYPRNNAAEYLNPDNTIGCIDYIQFKELAVTCARGVAHSLKDQPKDSYVGLRLRNCPEWGAVFWGILMAGFRPVMIDAQANAEVVRHILKQAGAVALVADGISDLCNVTVDYKTLLAAEPDPAFKATWADHVAFCSSGTTGMKVFVFDGVAISSQVISARNMGDETDDIIYDDSSLKNLALLPFHHIFGFVAVFLWYTFFGRTLVFLRDISPETILTTCQTLKVTHIYAVPMLWNNIAKTIVRKSVSRNPLAFGLRKIVAYSNRQAQSASPQMEKPPASGHFMRKIRQRMFGDSVRYMISGGSYISPETISLFNCIGYPLYNGYGMTETGVTSVELSKDPKQRIRGSIGRPLYGVEYAIDAVEGTTETGELKIRGALMHIGRLVDGQFVPRSPEDEWLRTGDMATRGSDGRYWITGRIKDIIINASGENIPPDELEASFSAIPFTKRLCVLGIKNATPYEDITLAVEPNDDAGEGELAKIRDYILSVNAQLPLYKKIKTVLIVPIPMTTSMKIQRQKLKKDIENKATDYKTLNLKPNSLFIEPAEQAAAGDVRQMVREAFAQALNMDITEIADDANFVFDLGGDSFSYISLISIIQAKASVEIPGEMYAKLTNVNEFVTMVENSQSMRN